ncbi:VanZ family protein [Parabacteroides sp. PF5-5]|uniref:VanZ family protein n=1 Tax=unclassified Parabacteroides TaxID=2649774 RepID=UPI00247449A5|nr:MULTISPECIES: VanZ family protein [unclassified Parabacteroides]MDH6306448.1 VanZ family protein [Parabacteroides sp. PH5-39]MDH6317400.1 VanZ family protein [Parabacteroides sp. PF5-13]MDH6321159.1 VanZ family protein [Parabacteroides sp. PH5-13]MDH6324891.1 VanZ family protein [Parabacteroides sp. PH5-8]MDH6328585.1 VanZ family protein [Parabacteroides sp. PH5-41]
MLYYIKKYPFSLTIILIVLYLSFFKPPSLDMPFFPGIDKVAHFCMYGGMSGMLWLEYLLNHRRERLSIKHIVVGAILCPIMFSGIVELGQEYLTAYRGGDWFDFLANTGGVLTASLFCWYVLRPRIIKKS